MLSERLLFCCAKRSVKKCVERGWKRRRCRPQFFSFENASVFKAQPVESSTMSSATPRERELQERLDAKDRELQELREKVEQLERLLTPRAGDPAPRAASPFGRMPAGLPTAAAAAASGARPMSPRPGGTENRRPVSPRNVRPSSPRPAFGSTVGMARKASPAKNVFHASMRGGPLPPPMPQKGLTERERADPQNAIRGEPRGEKCDAGLSAALANTHMRLSCAWVRCACVRLCRDARGLGC